MNPEMENNPSIKLEKLPETLESEKLEEIDFYTDAKDGIIKIIGENIFDDDLEQALLKTVTTYFTTLRAAPRPGADPFDIPSLNQKIWDTFHDYENFIHKQRFENIDLNELGHEVRDFVTPKVTEYLREKSIEKMTKGA